MKSCYCCSGIAYKKCCQPYINGISKPKTAVALMRSRFTAFALRKDNYIKKTAAPPVSEMFIDLDLSNDSKVWVDLKILDKKLGGVSDDYGEVEFKAGYKLNPDSSEILYFQERSIFKKINNRWYYSDQKYIDSNN